VTGQTLKPETYAITNAGQLEVNAPLSVGATRFVAVQVPEGPVLARVENKSGTIIWSELVLAQPRIIDIVGPY
jgi:hypothetical protein